MTARLYTRHVAEVDHIADGAMLVLWRQGYDTNAIAKKLGLHEFQVANELPRLRAANPRSVA